MPFRFRDLWADNLWADNFWAENLWAGAFIPPPTAFYIAAPINDNLEKSACISGIIERAVRMGEGSNHAAHITPTLVSSAAIGPVIERSACIGDSIHAAAQMSGKIINSVRFND